MGTNEGVLWMIFRTSSTSFFFTNFPDDATRSVLWKAFATAGKVVDVFIPVKVDKLGRRFGFVRFKDVEDVDQLKQKLDGVWLGSYKLHTNHSHGAVKGAMKPPNGGAGAANQINDMVVEKGKEAVDGGVPRFRWGEWPEVGAWKQKPFGVNRKNEKTFNIEYEVNEERVNFLNSCYVGVLAEDKSATPLEVEHSLAMEGYHAIKVSPMGGDTILLSSSVEGAISDAIMSNKTWWSTWFRSIRGWRPEIISPKRRVWVRCVGVPLHVWEENFFNSLALRFGKCVQIDEHTKDGSRFDVGRFRIITDYDGPIDQVVNLFVGGELFPITVVEERYGDIDGGSDLPPLT